MTVRFMHRTALMVATLGTAVLVTSCSPPADTAATQATPPLTSSSPSSVPSVGTTGSPPSASGEGTPRPDRPAPGAEPETVASGLQAPWSVAFLDGVILVSERDSDRVLEVLPDGSTRVAGTVEDVTGSGEGGLLGMTVDDQQRLYVYSTAADGNRIQRFSLTGNPGSLELGEAETLIDGIPAASYHDGGRLAFGPDGMLYATTGDAGWRDAAQDRTSLAGKILRMTPDGDVPPDNPFPGSLTYSYGHRNPQGLTWADDGTMFATEFGQNTWDELNIIKPGTNYGWPEVEGIADTEGFTDPVQQWEPEVASPSGMTHLDGTLYIANLRGQVLRTVPVADPGSFTDYYTGDYGRFRDVTAGPDGGLWILTSNTDGRGDPSDADDRLLRVPVQAPCPNTSTAVLTSSPLHADRQKDRHEHQNHPEDTPAGSDTATTAAVDPDRARRHRVRPRRHGDDAGRTTARHRLRDGDHRGHYWAVRQRLRPRHRPSDRPRDRPDTRPAQETPDPRGDRGPDPVQHGHGLLHRRHSVPDLAFVAGAFSGIIWGMLAAYGRRISPPRNAGLSLAIVSTGAPVGFALGTPLGSWLGMTFDWRWSFIGLSLVAVVAACLIAALAPDASGQRQETGGAEKLPLGRVFRIPGIAIILAVILTWMLAHNTIYTYISPYLRATSSTLSVDVLLLVFGIASIGGVVLTGALLDRYPRPLLHTSVVLVIAAGALLLVGTGSTPVIVIAAVLWGITFGGASAQLQGALTSVGGENADVANSFLPVAFNIAIFIAGILGAALLTRADGLVLPVIMIVFGAIALLLTIYGRRTAFRAHL